jgi:ABC-2 type transport system ATP-binding protein
MSDTEETISNKDNDVLKGKNNEEVIESRDLIVARNLDKTYHGKSEVKALSNLSFTVKRGGVFTLLGRNGSGKTTTVKLLSTLLRRESGDLSVFGFDPNISAEEIRKKISIVPQEGKPIEYLTPRESIYFYLRMRGFTKEEAERRTEMVIIDFLIDNFSDQRCFTLSVGQKQIVLVAMAFAPNPELIFLDEPTIGLDPLARQRVWKKIIEIKSSTTIFLTTHYMEEAEFLSDIVLIIKEGKSIKQGSPKELIKQFKYKHKVTINNYGNENITSQYIISKKLNDSLVIYLNENELDKVVQQLVKDGLEITINKVSLEDVFISVMDEDHEK